TGRTRVTAQATIGDYATAAPQLHASITTGNAEIGELVRVARAYGFSGGSGLAGSGSISLNFSVSGPLSQSEKWTYSGQGAVSNATLHLTSLAAKPLEVRTGQLRLC